MSNLCPDLATKEQLASLERQVNRELERKISTTEKDSIVNDGGLKGKSLVAGTIALIGGTANNAWNGANQALGNADNAYRVTKSAQSTANQNTSNISNVRSNVKSNTVNIGKANSEALSAKLTARKANYQSLYNASKTASNANRIAGVGKQALRALNLVANVYSILSSFATTAALAYLTKQVVKLNNAVIINTKKIEQNRIRSIKNNEIKIETKVDQLGKEIIQKDNQVDQKQVQDINNKLDKLDHKISNFPSPATIALAVGGLDILRQIKQNSSKSTCQAPALVPPVAAQAKANGAATLGLQTLNTAQNAAIQKTVNVTKNIVTHPKYGLQAIQNFAQTAWKATRIGKVLEYLSLAATIHNAAMLSRNLGGSLGDTISAIANNTISLIKNEEFQGININETLGNSIEGFLKNLIGAENYTGVSETLSKYNRIINSASNVIYSITSIQAGLAQGLETIGNYTGRIGNALKKSGQVLESSYGWMSEKTSVKTGRLGQIQRVIDTGEGIENVLSDVENATQEFRESQESVNNIGQQYNKVKTEFTKQETEKAALETTVKTNSQGAQPELTDFVKDPIEE